MEVNDEKTSINIDEIIKENEVLTSEIKELKKKPTGNIAYIILALGFILFGISIVHNISVLAFIGIALILWGSLFLYVKPKKFIRRDILTASINNSAENVKKIISKLDYRGQPTYISPGSFKGITNVYLCIPKENQSTLPSDETLSDNILFLDNPPAIVIAPPGLELAKIIEKEMRTNFAVSNIDYISNNIEKVLVENLELVHSLEIKILDSTIEMITKESVFNEHIEKILDRNEIIIGDPLTSAIACILALITRKPIFITSMEKQNEGIITKYHVKN